MAMGELPVISHYERILDLKPIKSNELSKFNLSGNTNIEVAIRLDHWLINIIRLLILIIIILVDQIVLAD